MKIHIIGCSGSGKTYLAKALAKKQSIPHFDLDDLFWDNSAETYGVKMPVEKRDRMVQDIMQKPDWIVEGVYYGWVGQCFADADMIYILDIPRRVVRYRILRRFFRRKLGLEPGKKETLKSLQGLLRWVDTFQEKNMKEIRQILRPHEEKVRILRTKKEVREIIEG